MVDDVAVGVRDAAQLEVGRVGAVELDAGDHERLPGLLARRHAVDVVPVADADGGLSAECEAGDAGVPPHRRRTREALAAAGRRERQAERHQRDKHHLEHVL
eukprot:scaffold111870_cov66-Phaeocystis_antarctica.AAC.3